MDKIRIRAVNFRGVFRDIDWNLRRTEEIVKEAAEKSCSIVLFPELAVTGYSRSEALYRYAESVPGRISDYVRDISYRYGVTVITGLLEKCSNKYYISQIAAEAGELKGLYRKFYLSPSEAEVFSQGSQVSLFSNAVCRYGIQICYDTHFPELSTAQAANGAEILFMAFATPGNDPQKLYERLMRYLPARAYDNSCYLVFCNHCSRGGEGQVFPGVSGVIDPKGRVIGENLDQEQESIDVDLCLKEVDRIRGSVKGDFISKRRFDIGYS